MPEINLQVERSLLQKAVRRGSVEVVEKTVKYLLSQKDSSWLHKRLPVMIYEECWPLGNQITNGNILNQYVRLAQTVKNKDAAGLATLAMNYYNRDRKALRGDDDQRTAITSVKNAIDNPAVFWEWARSRGKKQIARIDAARAALPKANFETDKMMMFAAAYFAAKDLVPLTSLTTQQQNPGDFPYWIAFDKHTEIGREIIEAAAKEIDIYLSRAMRIAFYFEGTVCNEMTISPYWQLAKDWQIERMNYTYSKANMIWDQLKPIIIKKAQTEADELKERINNGSTGSDSNDQLGLGV
ncbi:MAG: hypothetical protein HND52_20655 [Ignavibacteriae bacterium]|nr:hypothetical protein [Ignavibacteriota bacterium]NOH00383.1 hypothetical protein [Ignavibacteriota bacterium]